VARVDGDDREPAGDRESRRRRWMQRSALVRNQRRPNRLKEDAADSNWAVTVAGDRRGAKSRVAGGEIEERGVRLPVGEIEEAEVELCRA